jgi:hypothetical protein
MDIENVRKVYQLSTSAEIDATLSLENVALSEEDVVRRFESALGPRR